MYVSQKTMITVKSAYWDNAVLITTLKMQRQSAEHMQH